MVALMTEKDTTDGTLTLLTGISEPKSIPRTFMLWTGTDWVRAEDESVGNARLAYLTAEGAIEAAAYFGIKGIRAKIVLVMPGRGRVPFTEGGIEWPNEDIADPEVMPEYYMLWTGSEWMPAGDAIGDPFVAYLNHTDAEDGYDDHMDDGLMCMPIMCRDNADEEAKDCSRRSRGKDIDDFRKQQIVTLKAQGLSNSKIAKTVGTHTAVVALVLEGSKTASA